MGTLADLEPGDPRAVGRYRVVARIGAGGMGQVYLGRSPGGRPVAVKVVRPDLAGDQDFRRRFARETAAARRVNGAFTAGVVDADPEGFPPWLATIYVPGMSLGEALSEHGPWPEQPTLTLGAGLAEALEAIHAAGVIHRDLKPSNVLLAVDGPRVIDFGISRAAEASTHTQLTLTGTVVGTPGFMSPEQLRGDPVGPASDVFSVAAVLVYVATGTGPFGTGPANALNFRTVYEAPDLSRVPPVLRAIVADCLAKDPGDRPGVAALLDRLAEAGGLAGGGTTAPLTEAEWMPDPVAREVREQTSASLPKTPPPTPTPAPAPTPTPAPTPAPGPTPTPAPAPAPAPAPEPRQQPAPPPVAPSPPVTPPRPVHPAPAHTTHPARPWGPPTHAHPTYSSPPQPGWPAPVFVGPTAPPAPRPLSRRNLLLGLSAGAVGLGGAAFIGWKALDRDSKNPSTAASSPPSTPDSENLSSKSPSAPASGGRKVWEFDTGDPVRSSPTVVDGIVYVGSDCGCLYALDAKTGSVKWSFHIGGDSAPASPAVMDGVVYMGADSGDLYAVDAAAGDRNWRYATGGALATRPLVLDGTVYVGGGGDAVHVLDAESGTEKWSSLLGDAVESSPAAASGVVYVGSDAAALHALDADSGRSLWSFAVGGAVKSGPVVVDDVVYFGADDGKVYALET